jgi:methyl-accepting chemotaxis protein
MVLSGVGSVIASGAVTTLAIMLLVKGELTNQANTYQDTKMKILRELLEEKGKPQVVNGKLQFGDYVVNGNYEVVDKLVDIAGGTATIFLGDTRVSTNVKKDDGTRAVGTPLIGVAKEITIDRVQPYRGEADILGVPYFTAYDPIVDSGGRAFGVLYVGVKQEEFFRSFSKLIGTAVAIAILMAGIFAAVISYTAGRLLGRLSELARTADAVSTGESLDVPLQIGTEDEVGELARSVDRLRESMKMALERLDAA